jgi:hypothetical protein
VDWIIAMPLPQHQPCAGDDSLRLLFENAQELMWIFSAD